MAWKHLTPTGRLEKQASAIALHMSAFRRL
jgi:hypothetical protein